MKIQSESAPSRRPLTPEEASAVYLQVLHRYRRGRRGGGPGPDWGLEIVGQIADNRNEPTEISRELYKKRSYLNHAVLNRQLGLSIRVEYISRNTVWPKKVKGCLVQLWHTGP